MGQKDTRAPGTVEPRQRVVLLGASNVARSLPTVVDTVQSLSDAPVEIMAAVGHGRSYGKNSWVLGRKISGILPSELWPELARRPQLPTVALVTDIGNDILYGSSINLLLEWVEACLDRLASAGARTTITLLPIDSLERLDAALFLMFRSILFPRSRLTLHDARSQAREVNQRLIELAESHKTTIFPVRSAWYGFDPIHLRWPLARAAWRAILSTATGNTAPRTTRRSGNRRTCARLRRGSDRFSVSHSAENNRAVG